MSGADARLINIFTVILLLSIPVSLSAQDDAPAFLPLPGLYDAVYADSLFNVDDELIGSSEFTSTETITTENENGVDSLSYEISPFPPQETRTFFVDESGIYLGISDILDSGFLDDLGLDIDSDLQAAVLQSGVEPGTSELLAEEIISVPLPDTLGAEIDLPPGTSLGDEIDIAFRLKTTRLENITIENTLGTFEAAGNRVGFSVDLTVYIELFIGGPIPITFTLLEDYGPEFWFAEGFGLVREHLPATEIRLSLENEFFEIDELLTTIDGRTIEKIEFEEQPVYVSPDEELPGVLELQQNYPNPFNPATQLRFTLAEPSAVRIEVSDVQGRLVSVIDEGVLGTGAHQVMFDGSNLASGVYLYRVTAEASGSGMVQVQTSRFTVLK